MKNKTLRILNLALAVTTALSTSAPVFAYEVDEQDNSVESIDYQNTIEEDFSNPTNVFAQLSSEYKVTIPKTVVLSGATKDARYFVKVEGDIAGYEQVKVVPEDDFKLYTKNKDAQKATINQDKTLWTVSDFDTNAIGNIKADTITAGSWQGKFNFNISFINNEEEVPATSEDGSILPTAKAGLFYTGKPQTLLNAGKANTGKFLYSLDKKTWESTIPEGIEAGTYTVYFKKSTDKVAATPKSVEVVIEKAEPKIEVSAVKAKISNSENTVLKIENFDEELSYNVSSSDTSVADVKIVNDDIVVEAKNEGVATITLEQEETENIEGSTTELQIDVGHNYEDGFCTRCGERDINILEAGMYDSNWNLTKTWDQLKEEGIIKVNGTTLTVGSETTDRINASENTANSKISGYIVVEDGITNLGDFCFGALHNLNGVVLPASLESMASNAFYGPKTMNFYSIMLKEGNTHYKTVDGILYNIDMTELIKYPQSKTDSAFIIPNSVDVVGPNSFAGNTKIQKIVLHNGVYKLSANAFDGCTQLSDINLEDGLQIIEQWVFSMTNIKNIELPDTVTELGLGCMNSYGLRTIYIPSSVKNIYTNNVRGIFSANKGLVKAYCEPTSKPEGWANNWNYKTNGNVIVGVTWGVSRQQYEQEYKVN